MFNFPLSPRALTNQIEEKATTFPLCEQLTNQIEEKARVFPLREQLTNQIEEKARVFPVREQNKYPNGKRASLLIRNLACLFLENFCFVNLVYIKLSLRFH